MLNSTVIKKLEEHYFQMNRPELGSLNGDPYTDLYNDILVLINDNFTYKEIGMVFEKYASPRVRNVLKEFVETHCY